MNRQKLALAILLLVFALSLAYSFLRAPRQQRVAKLTYAPGVPAPAAPGPEAPKQGQAAAPKEAAARVAAPKGGAAAPKGEVDETRVHLELLERETPRFSGFRRNIFSPIFREEVKPPPFKPLPPPRPVKALLTAPPPQPAAAPAPPSIEQIADSELAKFTFLGFLEKNGEKTVFLSGNNEIFLAKKGSSLGPKFQVTGLTDDAITIRSVAGGRELVIPLVENRVLGTRRSRP